MHQNPDLATGDAHARHRNAHEARLRAMTDLLQPLVEVVLASRTDSLPALLQDLAPQELKDRLAQLRPHLARVEAETLGRRAMTLLVTYRATMPGLQAEHAHQAALAAATEREYGAAVTQALEHALLAF